MTYTFNGKGEFVLVRADTVRHKLDVQARFEAIPNNIYGTARATVLTAVAGKKLILTDDIFIFMNYFLFFNTQLRKTPRSLWKFEFVLLTPNGDIV
jgi:hypothetical protein